MPWVSTANAAVLLGKTERTIRNGIKQGIFRYKSIPHPSRKDQVSYLVLIGTDDIDNAEPTAEICKSVSAVGPEKSKKNQSAEIPHNAEVPGFVQSAESAEKLTCSVEFPQSDSAETIDSAETPFSATAENFRSQYQSAETESEPYVSLTVQQLAARLGTDTVKAYRLARAQKWAVEYRPLLKGGRVKIYHLPLSDVDKLKSALTAPSIAPVAKTNALTVQNVPCLVAENSIPEKELQRAGLRGQFCQDALAALAAGQVWANISAAYNSGQWEQLFAHEGPVTCRTLQNWVRAYRSSGDTSRLARHYQGARCQVTGDEQNYLLALLLDGNRKKPGSAIRALKHDARLGRLASPSSVRALQRWVNAFKDANPIIWARARESEKFVKDVFMPSIKRNISFLRVGDVLFADGHTLAFDIMDPLTGKPRRMCLIMFFDWASRMPVGAALARSEDSAHIAAALRAAILTLGFTPRLVYLDNGRAFKSKLFNDKWNDHDLAKELGGIFPRLGIQVQFATAYNGRTKPIERFFRTFQEQFERFMDTWRGSSAFEKPAYLSRNEEWHRKLKDRQPLTMAQAYAFINYYCMEFYGQEQHSGINGQRPADVLRAAAIPPDRAILPDKLNFLMLKAVQKRVQKEGIRFLGQDYIDADLLLCRHVGKKVIVRYDLQDIRSLVVSDSFDRFICQANLRVSVSGMTTLDPNRATSEKELKKQQELLAKEDRLYRELTQKRILVAKKAVESLPQPVFTVEDQSVFNSAPLLPAPPAPAPQIVEAVPVEPVPPTPVNADDAAIAAEFNRMLANMDGRL